MTTKIRAAVLVGTLTVFLTLGAGSAAASPHASWMNLVEVWFGSVERQAIRRGVFKSVKDLNAKIRAFNDGWHHRAHPFVCTMSVSLMD